MRKVYLDSLPRQDAKHIFLERANIALRVEEIAVPEACGKVTATAIIAENSLPGFPASAMDGIAVRSQDTFGANDQNPLVLVSDKDYIVVDTGDPMPEGFDSVIKIEDIQELDNDKVEILAAVPPGQHVRPVGEDVVVGEIIVPAYQVLTPPDLGALLAGGITQIKTIACPRITIIPTGDELVAPGIRPKRGEITEFNSTVIAAYLRQWGAEPQVMGIVKDNFDLLRETVTEALKVSDMVIINAGSSAGRDDYTFHVIKSLGEALVHGIATKPGKPTVLGLVDGKPVIGLPGYPVSAYLALDWFVKPLLSKYYNSTEIQRTRLKAVLGRRVVSEIGSEEFVRMAIGYIDNRFIATPLGRGAGAGMSLAKSDGLLVIPANSLGYEQGETVDIELYKSENQLKNTISAVGSHDMALDLLASALRKSKADLFLSSSHVGSMGGIMAIKKKEAHLAGVHLLDATTGQYNVAYIRKYLESEDVLLVNMVYRLQGWLVEKGNPLGIKTIKDIAATKAAYINRQKGAGTRILFDYMLQQEGLVAADISGYNREEYTHLNVAAAVAAGTAKVGLAILPAAKAYDLEFIPVGEERYDILMTRGFYRSEKGQLLLKTITDSSFQQEVESMGGYSMRDAGKIFYSLDC